LATWWIALGLVMFEILYGRRSIQNRLPVLGKPEPSVNVGYPPTYKKYVILLALIEEATNHKKCSIASTSKV
jgi:hypothetical protein